MAKHKGHAKHKKGVHHMGVHHKGHKAHQGKRDANHAAVHGHFHEGTPLTPLYHDGGK